MEDKSKFSAVIIGAGDGLGASLSKKFASEGYIVCPVRRPRNKTKVQALANNILKNGGEAVPFGVDARDEEATKEMFHEIETKIAPIEIMIFNIGANVFFPILETSSRVYRKVWEMCAFAGFLSGKEAAKYMLSRNKGSIFFTGATASIRGGSGFSAFASGKFALRALAQSMARELGPQGIHVAHMIIDGAIDTDFIKKNFPDRYKLKDHDGILLPDKIAQVYIDTHRQHRSAWTHELDLRPYMEKF
jgi:short-subunit dehydrogenase